MSFGFFLSAVKFCVLNLQSAGEKVDIIVSRQIVENATTIKNPWATDKTLPRNSSASGGWEQGVSVF